MTRLSYLNDGSHKSQSGPDLFARSRTGVVLANAFSQGRDRKRLVLEITGLAVVYVAAAKFGLSLTVAHGNATAVWAPTGISLAAVLVFGYRILPGAFLGALIANITTPIPAWVAVGIAGGNTLEAFMGAFLLRRLNFRNSLARVRDALSLSVAGAAVSTMFSATVGVTLLWLAGEIPSARYDFHWNLWWLGDLTGNLLVAPLLLTWSTRGERRFWAGRTREAVAFVPAVIVVGALAFFDERETSMFLIFPLMVWAALRFGQLGTATALFITSALGIWATLAEFRPLDGANLTESVQLFQGFMSVLAVCCLVIAATISERERVQAKLRLKAEHLQGSEAALAEAQHIAALGSWEWEVASNEVTWSDEMFRLHGMAPRSGPMDYTAFLECVHPDDRVVVVDRISAAMAEHEPFSVDHRVVLPDGGVRWVNARADVVTEESGTVTKLVGTSQNITERKEAEAKLRHSEALLVEAQRAARLGTWEWDIERDAVTWSPEMYEIYAMDRSETINFEKSIERMSEEQRAEAYQAVANAFRTGAEHDLPPREFEITLPDGSIRVLSGTAHISFAGGKPVRMSGTVQDITVRQQAEENARMLEQAVVRQRQALEINDEVVQGLSVAKYALDAGDADTARRAVGSTLRAARLIVSDLLAETDQVGELGPGRLVREKPATLDVEEREPR